MQQVKCNKCGRPITVTATIEFHCMPLILDDDGEFIYNVSEAEDEEGGAPFVNACGCGIEWPLDELKEQQGLLINILREEDHDTG